MPHADRITAAAAAAGDATLMREASATDASRVASVARLRAGRDPAIVAAALGLAAARAKAEPKFGERAATLLADAEGVEQASSLAVAAAKASRFAAAARPGDPPALDLGCGVGGDLIALAEAGVAAIGIDADPLRAWMAGRNAGVPAAAARIEDLPRGALACRLVHLDPARRAAGRRLRGLGAMLPGPAAVRASLAAAAGGCVKLAPGVDRAEAATLAAPGAPAELGFVSASAGGRSTLVQALLWTGRLAGTATRSASLVRPGGVLHRAGEPSTDLGTAPPAGLLLVPDPALERAELLPTLGLPELAPGLGVLTADALPADAGDAAWLTAFELLEELAFRPEKVAARLRALDAGEVTVKTRGRACEPDALARRWSGAGEAALVVLVLRLGRSVRAMICRRADADATA
ncbi:class I SAM-dependent methyltransferase [Phycisphaera mikurensis]|uniref:THUMP-like domain-containing protein n=1 Tax=Phycisphaera mikurensis (strain NBRC 102666 / KCTC 22515 / FYK2301M01) TaxID=1142394 RepID=I0IDE8_PHYMF|nr:class I SAM-dependent methyltransferase [Phycisphaera mikurensis]MBB6443328.1 SAM-dependent methyltransferase [Phycisphaera mikurensis]BAM03286.1 hypothetical protein PSMK_11270 [Phycisphaera mikurensis NBRC 102666]